jgi:hypothetical protein
MATYQIDGVDIDPQPITHEWDSPVIVGHDGDGAPIYARYRSVTLENPLTLCAQDWIQYRDGSTHSIRIPEPGTVDDSTVYTSVFIDNVSIREVERRTGMNSVSMEVIRIVV